MTTLASTSLKTLALATALATAGTASTTLAAIQDYAITGGYAFAQPATLSDPEAGLYARAGLLTGAWQLSAADGTRGQLHIEAATAVRLARGESPALMGTMVMNMAEFHGTAPGADALHVAYEAPVFAATGPTDVRITVQGRVVGGRGRYANASGSLLVVSHNGFIEQGRLLVDTDSRTAPDAAAVRGFVARYFEGTRSGSAPTWAAAFAPTAVVEDPVGTPELVGPEAILKQGEGFVSAFREVGLREQFVMVDGLEAVAHWRGEGVTRDGRRVRFSGINHFEFDSSGRILRLKGWWDPAAMTPVN